MSAGAPIFVIGAPRSGTTLLRIMLSSHRRIYIPPESDFIPRLYLGRARTPMGRDRALRDAQVILGHRRFLREWRDAVPDPAAFVDALPELTPAALLDALYRAYAAHHGAARWGDKSPIYTHYIPLLAEIFPSAQFVHLIRDGRDAALSTLAAYPDRFYVDVYFAAQSWQRRVRAARRAGVALGPARYVELRYEDLTADPEAALRLLCAFLGEDYAPAMCEPHKLARELLRPQGRHAPVREPVHPNSGGWRSRMPVGDQRLFHAVASDLLVDLGYDAADRVPLSPAERARVARLATKYRVLEGGRRILQSFGVFAPH
ncbi:MAG: sulfotransferase family protein [Acidimicrobiales bacterium]